MRLQRLHRRLTKEAAAGPQKKEAGYEFVLAIERDEAYKEEMKEESADLIVVSTGTGGDPDGSN